MAREWSSRPPHFVLVPFIAQGHAIPMVDVAHLLVWRGVRVTIATTKVNLARHRCLIAQSVSSELPLGCVELPFPAAKFGLPDGCENADMLERDPEQVKRFFDAIHALSEPLESYLRSVDPKPDCVIFDACSPWAADVARRLGIRDLVFHCPSAFFLLATHNLAAHGVYGRAADDYEPFDVPEFPIHIVTNRATGVGFFQWPGFEKLYDAMIDAEMAAEALVMNTFVDLERPFIEGYSASMGKKIFSVGPLCLRHTEAATKAVRGDRSSVDGNEVLRWLSSKQDRSVLYISFGSLARAGGSAQLIELGRALEASGAPFVWVVKTAEVDGGGDFAAWLAGGFEERVSGRGLVIKGWSPQMLILTHPAVGGFLTHCGWNSTLESISAGVPMLTWPCLADQFLNEKLIVDVLEVGVALGAWKPMMHRGGDDEIEIQSGAILAGIAALMDGGPEGASRRARVEGLAAKAKAAMISGGSSDVEAAELIRHVSTGASCSRRV